MTRIFGYESQPGKDVRAPIGAQLVLDNLQEAAIKTPENDRQAYGLGFIVVKTGGAKAFSIYRGYQGIKPTTNIRELLTSELHDAIASNPIALFGVLQNAPDLGKEAFEKRDGSRTFPLQSTNWMVITMGCWWNDQFSDENLPWYNQARPSLSTIQYLETNPQSLNFDWIDPRRTPYVIAVKKDGSTIMITDKYSTNNYEGFSYLTDKSDGLIIYQGIRDKNGNQV